MKEKCIQIIGIDVSNSEDFSCVSTMCSKCKHILEATLYNPKANVVNCSMLKKCPVCGTKFDGCKICE